MADTYHYPPELLSLLVDTIPLLCRSKNDVLVFFRGAGTPEAILTPLTNQLRADSKSVNKYQIARTVIESLNSRGDPTLAPRREIIKRVVEFEDFSSCWPADQLKAKGAVSEVRRVVNVKDSFTRMKQERDSEKAHVQAAVQAERAAEHARKKQISDLKDQLFSLFALEDKPQIRGKKLEVVLNGIFRAYGILVHEDFKRRDPDSNTVLEQVDGVILLDGTIHLVEMKWLKDPVGIADFSPHLVRLFSRANANGIFISNSEFTEPVLKECANALNQRTMFLCSLQELVMLLQNETDLLKFLRKKSQAAVVAKQPFLKVL
ncbi:restriction endonuclease [Congregibacter litoralis]|uniref:Acetyl-CoA hydrolase n=1 Tax=Congregibacter litoralis KT71 TaxID=314285 RepID=A4A4M7_9GAMM|nr:restriction endonuclease [Congregibacter litoralis]EAQ98748.1 Acetyl-CoA hydrolase [Congregibacter litoralis KT71]